ncbi:MAG: CBS domain-containing protein [Acidilobus sp.]
MKASEVLEYSEPIYVQPSMTIAEVAKLMINMRIDSVLVKSGGKVLGVVTEHDIVKAIAAGLSLNQPVSDIMSTNMIVAKKEEPLSSVVNKMLENNVRHLPVVTDDGKVVGVLNIKDVLRAFAAFSSWP